MNNTYKKLGLSSVDVSFDDQGIISAISDLKEEFKNMNRTPAVSAPESSPVIHVTPELKLPEFHFPAPIVNVEPKIDIQPVVSLGWNLIPIIKMHKFILANLILLGLIATINLSLIIYILTK